MSRNAESVDAGALMGATRYHKAAWHAFERDAPPPDPSSLSDRALIAMMQAMLQYETPGLLLPADASAAVESEWRRRGLSAEPADRVVATVVLALAGVSGTLIGWSLLTG
jgi:hypothetical protein